MNYKVVGFEHREGTSKKTGKPYAISVIHCIVEYPIDNDIGYGNRVEALVYNAQVNGPLQVAPSVGDYITPYYSRNGFFQGLSVSKV